MRRCKTFTALTLIASMFTLLLIEVRLQTTVAQTIPPEEVEDVSTCSLDPSDGSRSGGDGGGDCSATDIPPKTNGRAAARGTSLRDLTGRIVSLTDENFDDLTNTSVPGTWLVMFKTDACAICKKAMPAFEDLAVDAAIVSHNDEELEATDDGEGRIGRLPNGGEDLEEDRTPKGPVYVYEEPKKNRGGEVPVPRGPVYVATVDAGGWSGRDISKRFGVDATPTIIVLRNEGHDGGGDDARSNDADSRSYYVYRGQRAAYPLRGFVLGGYAMRRRMEMPPPLGSGERKARGRWGRAYESFASPAVKWAGAIVGKILLAWFAFMGLLGLFMRVHNYAWGEGDDDVVDGDERFEARELEIEREKARGREEYYEGSKTDASGAEERSARRQKIMWEQKLKNRAKFAANREARKMKEEEQRRKADGGGEEEEEEMVGTGVSVKRSDVQKGFTDAEKKFMPNINSST